MVFLAIIIGVVLFILSVSVKANNSSLAKFSSFLKFAGVLVIALGLASSMFKQIDAGKVGVQSLYGSVQPDVLESGLHVINPLLDVTDFDIQTQNYTMSAIHAEGAQEGDDAIRVLSNDGLEVVIDLTVLYRITPADSPKIFKQIGVNYTDKIVRLELVFVTTLFIMMRLPYIRPKETNFNNEFLKASKTILRKEVWFWSSC